MPAEWAAHAATWMIFPPAVYGGSTTLAEARAAWADVARTVARFEQVEMIVRPKDLRAAKSLLNGVVEFVEFEVDDAWARDVLPTFVRSRGGQIIGVDWIFNGWGQQSWAHWEHDAKLAGAVGRYLGVSSHRAHIVNEGGGIEVDGTGTVVLTKSVQLDEGRNGAGARDLVETDLHECLGVDRFIWLERGLAGDYQEFGTRGHVDLVVKFIDESVAVFHDQRDKDHPDYELSSSVRRTLTEAAIEAIALPAPARREVDGRVCDWSYVNCTFVNGALLVGTFDDEADDEALSVLRSALPGREVVAVDARTLFSLGGGVHCVTQQQPN